VVLRYYALSPRTRVGGAELAARLGWRFGWETRYPKVILFRQKQIRMFNDQGKRPYNLIAFDCARIPYDSAEYSVRFRIGVGDAQLAYAR
jgi:hypothetical protein